VEKVGTTVEIKYSEKYIIKFKVSLSPPFYASGQPLIVRALKNCYYETMRPTSFLHDF
jgi:hypothetical protein